MSELVITGPVTELGTSILPVSPAPNLLLKANKTCRALGYCLMDNRAKSDILLRWIVEDIVDGKGIRVDRYSEIIARRLCTLRVYN